MSRKILLIVPSLIILLTVIYYLKSPSKPIIPKKLATQYLPRSSTPTGRKFYQDTSLGFTFDYPSNLLLKFEDNIGSFQNGQILIYLSDKEDLVKFVTANCGNVSGYGPEYCPEDNIHLEKFTNKNNVEGYLITAKKITERYIITGTVKNTKDIREIAYKLPTDSKYYAIIFTLKDESDYEKLLDITNSFNYLPVKN